MSRNEISHFDLAPQARIQRSTFKGLSHSVKTSFNVGQLIPFYCQAVLPGDTFDIQTSKVCRLQTLITPMMDNMFLDTYFFFVPNRLVWSHWEQFAGGSHDSPWVPQVDYSIPQLYCGAIPQYEVLSGSLGDYFGLPVGVPDISVSALPARAYTKIVNDWFIDQNLTSPLVMDFDDVDHHVDKDLSSRYGVPFLVSKYHDYFTSCLPAPQKGPDVPLPLGDVAPVFAGDTNYTFDFPTYKDGSGNEWHFSSRWQRDAYDPGETSFTSNAVYATQLKAMSDGKSGYLRADESAITSPANATGLYPINLYTDLMQATATSINQLRMAFQVQKLLERDARGGTRYIEIIKSHFGVTSPDARLQRSEYLGGSRFPIRIHQVTQTSATVSGHTPLGDVAAMSVTGDIHHDFNKSFTEHGYIIGLMCARYEHSYQQGIPRHFSAKTRFDFYWPALSNIGEQAVKVKEVYAKGTSDDDKVFGYQEAWADYRYNYNRVTGEMRSGVTNSLDVWHLADNYASRPSLGDSWIREDKSNVDRVLGVTSSTANQIFADIYLDIKATRPMPMYSIPGLIDHF